jgi:Ca2+-transporting ATPase
MAEAEARLREGGPNELARDRPPSVLKTILAVMREPMLLLLLAAGVLYLFLGDKSDAITLLAFVLLVIGITIFQERRTAHALGALRDLASPRALVIRDGERRRVPGREVVAGDLVVLSEGDRVPADGVLVEAANLLVDESLLTGESVPVRKLAHAGELLAAPEARPGGDDLPHVYSGSLVVGGHGLCVVRATGGGTEMGRIGAALGEVEQTRTPLQIEIDRIVRWIAVAAVAVCVVLVATLALARGDVVHALLPGLTVAMALLPEEFPVVLTVFQAFGAYRISKHHVLARHVPAIEALGAATVLCTDKTGTLTENVMRIVRLEGADADTVFELGVEGRPELPESVHDVVEYGILASQPDPFDPMEAAFHDLGKGALRGTEHLHEGWRPLREYPLSPELLAMSHVYAPTASGARDERAGDSGDAGDARDAGDMRYVVAAKGAPEAVFDLCHLEGEALASLRARTSAMASRGLRVLAVARAQLDHAPLPAIQHDYEYRLVGLVGLLDPVRPEVPAAVAECRAAGIRVIMITGDSPETAGAIGRSIGLHLGLGGARVASGDALDATDEDALRDLVRHTSIFARVRPEQKLQLVRALAANGEVVAMTGDGVNDAPALKAAHIGIAMGKRGTDVAREAADLVLIDDHFASIVTALRLGRGIYDNLKKALAYVVAVHVPIAGMALLPPLLGAPMVLGPTHVALLQLVIDPACSLAFEAEPSDADVMKRPPRRADAPIFSRKVLGFALLQGLSVLLVDLAIYAWARAAGDELRARTLAFLTLIAGDIALIHVNRSWSRGLVATLRTKNRAALLITLLAGVVLVLVLKVPLLRDALRLEPLAAWEIALALGAGAASVAWFELVKWRMRAATRPATEASRDAG